jgi:hypothetical protein
MFDLCYVIGFQEIAYWGLCNVGVLSRNEDVDAGH